MTTGRAERFDELPDPIAALLQDERFAVMTTISADGSAHSVPVVFAVVGDELFSPIDHKPKSGVVLQVASSGPYNRNDTVPVGAGSDSFGLTKTWMAAEKA